MVGTCVLGALLIAAPAGGSTGAGLSSAQILTIALREARRSGDAHPTDITMASGPLKTASEVEDPHSTPGPGFPSEAGGIVVDLVAMHGRFFYTGPRPPSRPGEKKQPPSTVMELVINERGFAASKAWLADVPVPLSRLGPVTRLHYPGEPAKRRSMPAAP